MLPLPPESQLLDVLVVGGGPVGLACAIETRRAGLEHLVVEKGCLTHAVYRFPVNMRFFTTPELLSIGDHPLTCSFGKPTRTEALDYYRAVAAVEQLRVATYEEVTSIDGEVDDFRIHTHARRRGARTWRARRVVLATGYFDTPNRLGIPGEDRDWVSHYYTEAHPYVGQRVLIVGGRNSACDTALDLFRHGVDVTLVHRGAELGESVKYWVRPDVENRIAAGEIRARFRTVVEEIREETVVLRDLDSGARTEEAFDQVFLQTGYHPDAELLRACGLRPDPETLTLAHDPDSLESLDRAGIHLAGSVYAGYATGTVFIENGRFDAAKIAAHLASTLR